MISRRLVQRCLGTSPEVSFVLTLVSPSSTVISRLCVAALPSSGERSSSLIGTGSNDSPGSGKAPAHPLSQAWNINPDELAVCQHPDGSDWLLGTGSFGEPSSLRCSGPLISL